MPRKYRVDITQQAEKDIESIFDYIASDNFDAAVDFVKELEDQITKLEFFPNRCPLIPEGQVGGKDYRHLLY